MWKFRNSINALTPKKKTLKINCSNNLYYFHKSQPWQFVMKITLSVCPAVWREPQRAGITSLGFVSNAICNSLLLSGHHSQPTDARMASDVPQKVTHSLTSETFHVIGNLTPST